MKIKRLNNIELLRIISMLMVLILHYLSFGGFLSKYNDFSVNSMIVWLFESLSFVAVNCYVLICGYFSVNSKFKSEKLIKLFLEVFFYSFLIYISLVLLGKIDFSISMFLKSVFPVALGNYWFITCYVVLYILSPFLNKLITNLSKEEYKRLIFIIILVFSLWATFIPNSQTINYGGSYSISWFVCLYLISGYIRLHIDLKSIKKSLCMYIYLFCSCINVFAFYTKGDFLYNYYSITMLIRAISLFIFFLKIEISNKYLAQAISFISPATFGIYLIHENPNIRKFLWNIFTVPIFKLPSWLLILYVLFIPVLLFILFGIIDKLRDFIFSLFYRSNVYKKIKEKLRSIKYEKN